VGAGWNLSEGDGRTFAFDGLNGAGSIVYNASANRGQQAFNDYLVYDAQNNWRQNVSDLKLALTYDRQAGDGPLTLKLTKYDDTFTARIDGNTATLIHRGPGLDRTTGGINEHVVGSPVPLPAGRPLRIEFTDVTYQVTLRVNGVDLIQTTPEEYAPNQDRLMEAFRTGEHLPPPTVEIGAEKQQCRLSHVSLWRDIYYTNDPMLQSLSMAGWGTPDNPVHLHRKGEARENGKGVYDDDEYFVLGDNSAISGDARYWDLPIQLPNEELNVEAGRVPSRFMLGKAFFVYWPAGYRPLGTTSYPIIPNFGDMRFIH
jgi:hypothetical protein